MALYDPEEEAFKRQLAFSDALRKSAVGNDVGKMVGNTYVRKSPWVNAIEGLVSGYQGASAEAGQMDLQGRRDQEFQGALATRPDMMMDQVTPGIVRPADANNPDEAGQGDYQAPDTTSRVMKPYQQQQSEQLQYADRLAKIKHPMAQSLAAATYTGALDIPEKGMARQEAAAARSHDLLLKAKEAERLAQERRDDAAKTLANKQDEAEARRQLSMTEGAARDAAQARLVASLHPPAPAQIITTDQGIFERTRDGTLVQLQSADGKALMKPGGAGARGKNLEGKLETAHSLLDGLKAAKSGLEQSSGVYDVVPSGVRQYFTSPETKAADASVSSVSAEKAHELFGSAFTASEQSRASEFLPAKGDTIEAKRSKLDIMEKLVEKKIARLEGKPDPHPDMYATYKITPVLDEDVGAGKSALPTSTAAVAGAPRSFATEADATAANLKKGTPVVINGVKGTWQ